MNNEITSSSESDLQYAWPNVLYKGKEFFDPFYNEVDRLEVKAFKVLQDWQECYVGYLPNTDEFLVGWDVWQQGDDYFGSKLQTFKFADGKLYMSDRSWNFDKGFYRGPYKVLNEMFPNLKSLRLD